MKQYIDLFAGVGGFHFALAQSDKTQCVFASEIEPMLYLVSIKHKEFS